MKRALTVFLVTVAITTSFVVPVAAAGNITPPSDFSAYSDYEDYVQELLDKELITQKGANALLEDYNATIDSSFNYSYGRGGCWGYGGYGGCGRGYGGMGYGYRR